MLKMKQTLTLLFLISFLNPLAAGVFEHADLLQAYAYLNQLRLRAGMTPFSQNSQLEAAAFNHANYLADNFLQGHFEIEGMPGFTGATPSNRTAHAGYRSLVVSENVSSGESNSVDSIDGLMSAIYHRLGFLDFVTNEIGTGIAHVSTPQPHSAYVYNMGNSEYNALCDGQAFSGSGRFYFGICEPDIQVGATEFEQVALNAKGNNPNIVVWPTNDDNDVPPAFFEESPDPLPDYSVSGYPLSIQFNPLVFNDVNVLEFKLFRELDNSEIQLTRLLNQTTDPNGKLSALEYALFPLNRLEWNTTYRAQVKYTSHLGENILSWRFKTRSVGVPLFTIAGQNEVLSIPPATSTFAVYVPPTDSVSEIGQISYQFQPGMNIETEFKDANTLQITLTGNVGQQAQFDFSGGHFTVQIRADATLPNLVSDEVNNLPTLGKGHAVNHLGEPVNINAQFKGGTAINGGAYQKQVVQNLSDQVDVQGIIAIEPAHVGQQADIFVYAEYSLPPFPEVAYFMLGEGLTILLWDQKPESLVAFMPQVLLDTLQSVPMYQGQFLAEGMLKVFFGYRLADGTLINNEEHIEIRITH